MNVLRLKLEAIIAIICNILVFRDNCFAKDSGIMAKHWKGSTYIKGYAF